MLATVTNAAPSFNWPAWHIVADTSLQPTSGLISCGCAPPTGGVAGAAQADGAGRPPPSRGRACQAVSPPHTGATQRQTAALRMLALPLLLWQQQLGISGLPVQSGLGMCNSARYAPTNLGSQTAMVTLCLMIVRPLPCCRSRSCWWCTRSSLPCTAGRPPAAQPPGRPTQVRGSLRYTKCCPCYLADFTVVRHVSLPCQAPAVRTLAADTAPVHAVRPDQCAILAADSPIGGTAIAAAAFGDDGALLYAAMQRSAVIAVFAGDTLQPVARVAAPGLSAALSSSRFTDIAAGDGLRGGAAMLLLATSGGKVRNGHGCVHSAV
jgi:hypothetical protein